VPEIGWTLTTQGVETYLLRPRYHQDYPRLVDTLPQKPDDVSPVYAVIGRRGAIAPPWMFRGRQVHEVTFDRIFPFKSDIYGRLGANLGANNGVTDRDRALNYLLATNGFDEKVRSPSDQTLYLTGVEARPLRLGDGRRAVDVFFSYTGDTSRFVSRYFARVDVSGLFPFQVIKFQPYIPYAAQ
jgi:hypothetical protein